MDNILGAIGLAFKSGRLAAGEEPAGDACRAHNCRLLLTAEDASENTLRRARHSVEAGRCPLLETPWTKEELGRAVGRASCAVLAVTDLGFARAIAGRLAAADGARWGEAARELEAKEERARRRREAQRQRDSRRRGKRRPRRS